MISLPLGISSVGYSADDPISNAGNPSMQILMCFSAASLTTAARPKDGRA